MIINSNKIILLTGLLSFCFFQYGCSQRNFKKNKADTNNDTKIEEREKGLENDDISEEIPSEQNSLISIELIEDISAPDDTETIPTVGSGNVINKSENKKESPIVKDNNAEKPSNNKGLTPPPVAKIFRVRLKIQNKNEHPMWYLMPYKGNNSLQANGYFEANPNLSPETEVLEGRRYIGEADSSQLIEILYTGKAGHHFRAFYIPAQSAFTLSNYVIDCWQDADKVELWAVKKLLVNNQKSVAEWLPFSVLSSPNVVIRCDKNAGCSWEEIKRGNAIQPGATKNIQFIQADKINKYTVQLQTQ